MTAATAQDRDTRAADVGMWLFIASLVMFYGALYSGYVLLRAGSDTWAAPWTAGEVWHRTWLVGAAAMCVSAHRKNTAPVRRLTFLHVSAFLGGAFVIRGVSTAAGLAGAGHAPSSSVAAASWFVLTGVHAVLVLGGAIVTGWIALGVPKHTRHDLHLQLIERYWWLMVVFWSSIVVGFYVV